MRASIVLLLLCGCASGSSSSRTAGPTPGSAAAASISGAGGPAATAVIEPRSGSTLTGSASFTAVDGGNLGAHVEVQNATPGQHGVHIHEKGDCNDPKAASAGGHYNPNSGAHHGGPATPVPPVASPADGTDLATTEARVVPSDCGTTRSEKVVAVPTGTLRKAAQALG